MARRRPCTEDTRRGAGCKGGVGRKGALTDRRMSVRDADFGRDRGTKGRRDEGAEGERRGGSELAASLEGGEAERGRAFDWSIW